MRSLGDYNPIAVAVYFVTVSMIAAFCMNPILLFLSLSGAVALFAARSRGGGARSHLGFLGLFLLLAFLNPLVSHNGVTVLFVINDAPITAEAFFYGLAAAGMLVGTLYWFASFSRIMTSDKLLYLFGRLSPKLALVFSMGLRYVPLFGHQARKIDQTQKALGLYKEDNIVDRFKGGVRVFSVLMTWALENGIVTADSMEARGYGVGKRSHFSIFRFRASDVVFLLITLLLGGLTCISMGLGALDAVFYPAFYLAPMSPLALTGYVAYGILAWMPIFLELEEGLKWKYLRSRI